MKRWTKGRTVGTFRLDEKAMHSVDDLAAHYGCTHAQVLMKAVALLHFVAQHDGSDRAIEIAVPVQRGTELLRLADGTPLCPTLVGRPYFKVLL